MFQWREGPPDVPQVGTMFTITIYIVTGYANVLTHGTIVYTAFSESRRRYIKLSKDGTFIWISTVRETEPNEKIFLLEQVKELIEHLEDLTYVCFAGIIWHQMIGIPMGTNAAGYIANLYCFTYQLDFL